MRKSDTVLSDSLKRGLNAYGDAEEVIVTQRCRQLGGRLSERGIAVERLPLIDAVAVRANHRQIARLSARGDVGYIERNDRVQAAMDIARGTVGVLKRPRDYTGKGVVIALLDTGIKPSADFEGRILAFHDIVKGKTEPYDDQGHGTMCASCAASSGASSGGKYQGIAPEAGLVIVKTMDEYGGGTLLNVVRGLQWISEHRKALGIRVISMSMGLESPDSVDSLMRAVEALWRQGLVVVTAAGNSGPDYGTINSPGKSPSVVTVGAVDDRGSELYVPDFSSRGPVAGGLRKPEVCAPGVKLATTGEEGAGLFTGTSAATPIVAGCAALLLEKHPAWTPDMVKYELMRTAQPFSGDIDSEGFGCVYME